MNKLLKDAIADAKAVRETALAQAKLALEEAFAPKLQSMLSNKIMQEMGTEEEEEMDAMSTQTTDATDETSMRMKELAGIAEAEPEAGAEDEMGGDDLDMGDDEMGDMEGGDTATFTLNGTEYEVTPVEGGEDELGDEEGMGDEDAELDELLRQLEEEEMEDSDEMVSEAEEEDKEDMKMETMDMEKSDKKEEMDEEINLDELIQALKEGEDEEYKKAPDQAMDAAKGGHGDVLDERKKMKKMEEELNEAYSAVKYLREKLSEVNLLNAKLLYVNKLFRKNGLSETQKVKIIETFDRAKNVRETKLIYATLCESFNSPVAKAKKPVVENFASAPVKKTQVINEGNEQMNRFKKLAGIIKS